MADVDVEILKTLESIEDLLKSASMVAKRMPKAQAAAPRERVNRGEKSFRGVADTERAVKDTLLGLNKSLVGLGVYVGRTEAGFGSLNSQLGKFAQTLQDITGADTKQNVKPQEQVQQKTRSEKPERKLEKPERIEPTFETVPIDLNDQFGSLKQFGIALDKQTATLSAATKSVETFQAKIDAVNSDGISSHLHAAVPAIAAFIGALFSQASAMTGMSYQPVQQKPAPAPAQPTQAATRAPALPTNQLNQLGAAAQTSATAAGKQSSIWQMMLGRMLGRVGGVTIGLGAAGVALDAFGDVVQKLTQDFFSLSRVGMGSYNNLYVLSKNAMLAGMSLKEYTEVMRENVTFVSRAGSLENFERIASASDKTLASMGIFGSEARALQASLANSNTQMGVSQANLTSAIAGQISVFDKLRKSTNMTAAEFGELVSRLGKQEQVQKELVGLSGAERGARRQQLLDIATTGQRLGMASDEAERLSQALLRQRGETVKSRFESAGRVRQLAQVAGMGGQGERAAQIIMKGRNASVKETEELRKIAGSLDAATQSLYETGSFGMQNVIDVLGDTLNGKAFGDIMQANRATGLSEQSGRINQEAFGQHVDRFGQTVGEMLKYVRGFNESVLPAVATGIGATLLLVFRGPLTKLVSGIFNKTPAAPTAAISTGVSALQGAVNWISSIPNTIRKAYNQVLISNAIMGPLSTTKYIFQELGLKIANGYRAVTGMFSAGAASTFSSIANAGKAFGSSVVGAGDVILRGFAGVAKAFGPAAMIFDGVVEMFTGSVASALNPSGGIFNRIGGVITAALSAVPNMIIDVLGFVFGDSFGQKLQRMFDIFVVAVNSGVRGMLKGLVDGAAFFTKWLPDDSSLKKKLVSWSAELAASQAENNTTLKDLWNNDTSTLKKIAETNTKAAEGTKKSTEVATAKVQQAHAVQEKFNNVQYGAATTAQQMITDAKTLIGTPQIQKPAIISPTVNTPEKEIAPQVLQKEKAAPVEDTTSLLNAILKVLQQSLTEEQKQAVFAEQLLSRTRPSATFIPAEVTANRLLK